MCLISQYRKVSSNLGEQLQKQISTNTKQESTHSSEESEELSESSSSSRNSTWFFMNSFDCSLYKLGTFQKRHFFPLQIRHISKKAFFPLEKQAQNNFLKEIRQKGKKGILPFFSANRKLQIGKKTYFCVLENIPVTIL